MSGLFVPDAFNLTQELERRSWLSYAITLFESPAPIPEASPAVDKEKTKEEEEEEDEEEEAEKHTLYFLRDTLNRANTLEVRMSFSFLL